MFFSEYAMETSGHELSENAVLILPGPRSFKMKEGVVPLPGTSYEA
jgi:hypothetical protein